MTNTEKGKLRDLSELFKKMNSIIISNYYNDLAYGKRTLIQIVEYLEAILNGGEDEFEIIIDTIAKKYRSMFFSKAGLSEFHIWDEDYEIRQAANAEYEEVKKKIEENLNIN